MSASEKIADSRTRPKAHQQGGVTMKALALALAAAATIALGACRPDPVTRTEIACEREAAHLPAANSLPADSQRANGLIHIVRCMDAEGYQVKFTPECSQLAAAKRVACYEPKPPEDDVPANAP
jgi:hypothetical protein